MNVLTIFLGLLPGFAWLFFYLQEDLHPEPKKLIAKAFLAGILAAGVALFIEMFLNFNFKILELKNFVFLSFLALALVEETTKFFAAFWDGEKKKGFGGAGRRNDLYGCRRPGLRDPGKPRSRKRRQR